MSNKKNKNARVKSRKSRKRKRWKGHPSQIAKTSLHKSKGREKKQAKKTNKNKKHRKHAINEQRQQEDRASHHSIRYVMIRLAHLHLHHPIFNLLLIPYRYLRLPTLPTLSSFASTYALVSNSSSLSISSGTTKSCQCFRI